MEQSISAGLAGIGKLIEMDRRLANFLLQRYLKPTEYSPYEKVEKMLDEYVSNGYTPDTSELKLYLQAISADERFELLKKQYGWPDYTALHMAAARGDTEVMRCLLEMVEPQKRYELLKIQERFGQTPLHAVARRGRTEVMRCLLEMVEPQKRYELLKIQERFGQTPLHAAAERFDTEVMRCLLEMVEPQKGYKLLKIWDRFGKTPLHAVQCVLQMVDSYNWFQLPSISNKRARKRWVASLLMADVWKLDALLAAGVKKGWCLPGIASYAAGKLEEMLDKYVSNGYTPDTSELKQYLQAISADERFELLKKQYGWPDYTALHMAAARGDTEVMRCLLELVEPQKRYELLKIQSEWWGGKTALHAAARSGRTEVMKCMLQLVEPENQIQLLDIPDKPNMTALDVAEGEETVQLIRQYRESAERETADKMGPREYLSYVRNDLSLEERESLMSDERLRSKTFLFNWPHDGNLSGVKMAQAGFYCVDDYDRVLCVFCRGSLHKWEAEDNPMTEHAKAFPFCRFVKGLECGNKEYKNDLLLADELKNITPLTMPEMKKNRDGSVSTNSNAFGISTTKGAVIKYAPYETRKNTYGRWPAANVIRPEPLCEAGFYYTGFDDHVRCFFCSGDLRVWSSEDNPWEEHARWFPDCSYLLQHKGEIYVTEVHARTEDGKKCPLKTVLQKKTEKEWKQKGLTQQAMYELIVTELNHDRRAVDIAINRNGKTFDSVKEMLEAVYQVEEDENIDSDRMETDYQTTKSAIEFMATAATNQPIIVQEAAMGTDLVDGLQPGRIDTADSGPPPASCKTCYKKTSQVVQMPSMVPDNLKWIFNPSLHGISSAVPSPPSYLTDVLCYAGGAHYTDTHNPLSFERQQELDEMSPHEYIAAIRNLSSEELTWLMSVETRRRKTFLDNWLHAGNISGEKMAQAGFYHSGDNDGSVRCVFCGVVIHSWDVNDNPMDEHTRYSSSCRFLQGLRSGIMKQSTAQPAENATPVEEGWC